MPQSPYLSTDPNAGQPASDPVYLSTDPNAGMTPVASHAVQDFSQYGPLQQLLKEQARPIETRAFTKAALPEMAAMGATVLAPELIPARMAVAGGAGYVGARARGDDPLSAGWEGVKQGAIEAIPGVGKLLKVTGKGFMRGAVPAGIAKEFQHEVDIPQRLMDVGTVPGWASTGPGSRYARFRTEADAARQSAMATVPPMTARDVAAAMRPQYEKAVIGRRPDLATQVLDYVREARSHIGRTPMSGEAQLARKNILEQEGRAALNAQTPSMAARAPQLANTERAAIRANLVSDPAMAKALADQQASIAMERTLDAGALTNPLVRFRQGGVSGALATPAGLGTAGLAMYRTGQPLATVNPQMVRAALLALLAEDESLRPVASHQQE